MTFLRPTVIRFRHYIYAQIMYVPNFFTSVAVIGNLSWRNNKNTHLVLDMIFQILGAYSIWVREGGGFNLQMMMMMIGYINIHVTI